MGPWIGGGRGSMINDALLRPPGRPTAYGRSRTRRSTGARPGHFSLHTRADADLGRDQVAAGHCRFSA
jgi:hypothetical protein